MKRIYVIHENDEIILACETMEAAIAACINRIAICGYVCEGFDYGDSCTMFIYRDITANEVRAMFVDRVNFKEGE